jgi:hypothetical protein
MIIIIIVVVMMIIISIITWIFTAVLLSVYFLGLIVTLQAYECARMCGPNAVCGLSQGYGLIDAALRCLFAVKLALLLLVWYELFTGERKFWSFSSFESHLQPPSSLSEFSTCWSFKARLVWPMLSSWMVPASATVVTLGLAVFKVWQWFLMLYLMFSSLWRVTSRWLLLRPEQRYDALLPRQSEHGGPAMWYSRQHYSSVWPLVASLLLLHSRFWMMREYVEYLRLACILMSTWKGIDRNHCSAITHQLIVLAGNSFDALSFV